MNVQPRIGLYGAVLLLCAACTVTRNPGEHAYTGKLPELHVQLATDTVRAGENLTATISINNYGQPPHRLEFATGCQFDWTITAADGAVFSTRCLMCTQAPTFITLAGALYAKTIYVPTKRLCETPWPFAGDLLPPGRYQLSVFAIGYRDQFLTNVVAFDVVDE
ncbi:MAG TPA: hypothetical protein VFX92_12490 [Candidatus Krumholzibacteria bacterium]|nr:hypothetical protein [Candidatus Krumholzibacteria bacterium]